MGGLIILVAVVSYFAQSLSKYIPFEYEQKIAGNLSLQPFVHDESKESEDRQALVLHAENAIQELGQRLTQHSNVPKDIKPSFHLLDLDTPNAFATLGGHVFVTTGLLLEIESENGLAMVIAHEIAHIKNRHPIQLLSRGLIVQSMLALVFGAQDALPLHSILGQTSTLTMLSFNRNMEREADDEALKTLFKTYGTLAGSDQFFQKMSLQSESKQWQEIFSTHPAIHARLKLLRQKIPSLTSRKQTPLDARIVQLVEAGSR